MNKTITSVFLILILDAAYAEKKPILTENEMDQLILKSHCAFDNETSSTSKDFFSHYARIHDRVGIQCDYAPSIELSNAIDAKVEAIKMVEDTCRYDQKQLEQTFFEHSKALHDQSFYRHYPYDNVMGLAHKETPENPEKYTPYDIEGKRVYLINEQHIECDSLKINEIKDLKEKKQLTF